MINPKLGSANFLLVFIFPPFQVEFAYDLGMAGVMTWSIDTDDFRGSCGGTKFPLLRTLNNALYRREQGLYSGQGNAQTSLLALAISFILINIIK